MIIHKTNKSGYYICNEAVAPTKEKSSYRWNKVTCKNCRKKGHQNISDIVVRFRQKKSDSIFTSDKPIEITTIESPSCIYQVGKIIRNYPKPWYKKAYRYLKYQILLFIKNIKRW